MRTFIEVGQSDWKVGSDRDLSTNGLGPCVGIVVGYNRRVSMLHTSMPDAGGAEDFFSELSSEIPLSDRHLVKPVLVGAVSKDGKAVPKELAATRKWVEAELIKIGFGTPIVHWGVSVGELACQDACTCIEEGTVEITLNELDDNLVRCPAVHQPLW
jgi:hypothetical protein